MKLALGWAVSVSAAQIRIPGAGRLRLETPTYAFGLLAVQFASAIAYQHSIVVFHASLLSSLWAVGATQICLEALRPKDKTESIHCGDQHSPRETSPSATPRLKSQVQTVSVGRLPLTWSTSSLVNSRAPLRFSTLLSFIISPFVVFESVERA